MKVVLSRKGMDSRAGGIPSPILPDGTLLSLPIPNEKSGVPYGDLVYKGRTYQQIIQQIHPTFDFQKHPFCHLDPDIYGVLKNTHAGWKPAFGQYEIPAKHLDGQGVDVGDVFLFYGMFRKTEALPNGTLHFVKGAPIQHIIYGYMVVSEILKDQDKIKELYPWHPHAASTNTRTTASTSLRTTACSRTVILSFSVNRVSRTVGFGICLLSAPLVTSSFLGRVRIPPCW